MIRAVVTTTPQKFCEKPLSSNVTGCVASAMRGKIPDG